MNVEMQFRGTEIVAVVNIGTLHDLNMMSPRGRAAHLLQAFHEAEMQAAAFIDGGAEPERPLSSLSAFPTCSGCGTAVGIHGEKCVSCRMKDEARGPSPLIAIANQGTPPYKTTGNFRDAQKASEEVPS